MLEVFKFSGTLVPNLNFSAKKENSTGMFAFERSLGTIEGYVHESFYPGATDTMRYIKGFYNPNNLSVSFMALSNVVSADQRLYIFEDIYKSGIFKVYDANADKFFETQIGSSEDISIKIEPLTVPNVEPFVKDMSVIVTDFTKNLTDISKKLYFRDIFDYL